MKSKASIAGHPIHPTLVAFPIAFYTATVVCYIVYSSNANPFWFKVALVANIAGVITAGLAAIPGFVDWLSLPAGSQPKKTGLVHMVCNVTALALYGIAAYLACPEWNKELPALGLSIPLTVGGFLLTGIAGFLGGSLVFKHGVGVDTPGSPPYLR